MRVRFWPPCQEVTLGRQVLVCWGDSMCSLETSCVAVMALEYAESLGYQHLKDTEAGPKRKSFSFYHHAESIRALRKRSNRGNTFMPLSELLLQSRHAQATDLKDKVFSVIGFADPELCRLGADYRMSLAKVLTTSAKEILTKKHSLRLFGICQNPELRQDLPSWVPNSLMNGSIIPFNQTI